MRQHKAASGLRAMRDARRRCDAPTARTVAHSRGVSRALDAASGPVRERRLRTFLVNMLNGLQRLSFVEVYDRGNRHVLGMFLAMALLPARRDDSIALPPRLRRQFGPRPSSSGPGRRPFTAKTGVRFPLGAPMKSIG